MIKLRRVEQASLTHAVWDSARAVSGLDCRSARHEVKARTKMGSLHMARALQSQVTFERSHVTLTLVKALPQLTKYKTINP